MYYFPIIALTPTYFDRNRGAAMGIILAGVGVGGLVLSPVFHALLSSLGIHWALRILGIWNFVVSIPISSVIAKKHAGGAIGQTKVSMALVRRGTFVLQVRRVPYRVIASRIPVALSRRRLLRVSVLTRRSTTVPRGVPAGRREHGAHILPHDVLGLDPRVLERHGQSPARRQRRRE